MASSVTSRAASRVGDLGRKVVNRYKTIVGRDWDEAKKEGREQAMLYGYRGSSKGRSKTRKPSARSSSR